MAVTQWLADTVIKKLLTTQERRMGRASIAVQNEIKTLLNVGGGKDHTPSLPGEPPRKQSGRLYGSIKYRVIRRGNEIIGIVFTDDKKARRLELGFVGRDKLGRVYDQKPRPFMRRGFKNARPTALAILKGRL